MKEPYVKVCIIVKEVVKWGLNIHKEVGNLYLIINFPWERVWEFI